MDIYQAIQKDHRTAKSLFSKLLRTSLEDQERVHVLTKLKTILCSHHDAEEKVFYTALNEAEHSTQQIDHALEQHEEMMDSIEEIDPENLLRPNWRETVIEFQDSLLEHIKTEERVFFKQARQVFSDQQAQELAQDFLNLKEQAVLEILQKPTF